MPLEIKKSYFINETDVVLRIKPVDSLNKNSINHLILGDYVKYLGEENGDWVKVRSRMVGSKQANLQTKEC